MKLRNFLSGAVNAITVVALTAVVGTQLYANDHSWTKQIVQRITYDDVYCLRQNIFFEARNQTVEGQVAVAWVTLNRLDSSLYPNTICGVVKQAKRDKNGKPIRNMCHFSWYCDGKSDRIPTNKISQAAWKQAGIVAQVVLMDRTAGYLFKDPTHGSIMYHSIKVSPYWRTAYDLVTKVDDHIFYR
jgi:spore germination cell wall hydrolase CwlJ-like protein